MYMNNLDKVVLLRSTRYIFEQNRTDRQSPQSICTASKKSILTDKMGAYRSKVTTNMLKVPLLYQHENFFHDVSLQASHHSFVIVNDCEKQSLNKQNILEFDLKKV